jgi:hypothetical protein
MGGKATLTADTWSVRSVESWVRGEECCLTVSLGGQGGAAFARAAEKALADLNADFGEKARELPEHAAAVQARAALFAAQAKEVQLQDKLDQLQKTPLTFDGDLVQHAREEAATREQLDVVRQRKPRLRTALAEATTALVNAAAELRQRLRLAAVSEAQQQRQDLASKLVDPADVARAVEAGVIVDTLSRGFDEAVAHRLVGVLVPAVPDRGAPPAPPPVNPFAVPVWAAPPPEWPRQPASSTPAPEVRPPAPPDGWAPVTPEQAEKASEDERRRQAVAAHALAQRERQAREAAEAAGGSKP